MPVWRSVRARMALSAMALVTLAAATAQADPMYNAVNLIPGAVSSGLNDSGQLVSSWGNRSPAVYDGYGSWAGGDTTGHPQSHPAASTAKVESLPRSTMPARSRRTRS